ncbi:ERV/ALR sulfhydryl oxidase domain-containing protein [Lentinula detonsa]|uniref:Sulfhydryl oxidase n=1 Tax=Lentinula detonsa TaxID=2804962 RepID=A0A9W8P201_9AGAR|nr:ERV/ALR sulfhydryl oxidase domain-containing protein [Lentinula detonsa]
MLEPTTEKPLPPGMVLGPDGKPCKVCTSFRHWKPALATREQARSKTVATGAATTVAASSTSAFLQNKRANCPPDSEELGRATWTFLHTTAAYYPERPTPTQRANMLTLLRSLPLLYPCSHCAEDFGEDIKVNPPNVSGRAELSRWLCERHNEVNQKLGKETFNCAKTDERWKDGPADGSCD